MKKFNAPLAGMVLISLHIAGNHAMAAEETEAYKLAVVDANQFVPKQGIEEKRAAAAIAAARSVCDTPSDAVMSNQAVKLSNILAQDKIFSRPIDILEGLKAVLAGTKRKVDCSNTMAQYAGIRHSVGYTHSEAIASMRVLMDNADKLAAKVK